MCELASTFQHDANLNSINSPGSSRWFRSPDRTPLSKRLQTSTSKIKDKIETVLKGASSYASLNMKRTDTAN